MLVSPFAFFRGAAELMAADLAETPQSGLEVQLCGDAHLSNFGGFASPDRELVFDINDFDETARGPWEWDVKRLAASIAVAGRELGLAAEARRVAVEDAVRSYREATRRFATMRNLELWYARLDVARILSHVGDRVTAEERKAFKRRVAGARAKDHLRAMSKLAELVDGEPRIVSRAPRGSTPRRARSSRVLPQSARALPAPAAARDSAFADGADDEHRPIAMLDQLPRHASEQASAQP